MKLKNVALYAKLWYERGEVWQDIKICLQADGYEPQTKQDILRIVMRNVAPLFKGTIEDFAIDLIEDISPGECWKSGFFHSQCTWVDEAEFHPLYDYKTATLYFFLSKLQGATIDELDGLPKAKSKVLPLTKRK